MELKNALIQYLNQCSDDDCIIELFKRIRALQNNGIQLRKAILQACTTKAIPKKRIALSKFHKDNIPARLAVKYRSKLLKFRNEGFGYGKIAKLLAQRNIYNKQTGKAYSRSTIKRALQLLEQDTKEK